MANLEDVKRDRKNVVMSVWTIEELGVLRGRDIFFSLVFYWAVERLGEEVY
jgi:hypothetical protein